MPTAKQSLTAQDIKNLKTIFATKKDLKQFATKKDLKKLEQNISKKFATKKDLQEFVTKDDLLKAFSNYTKQAFETFATQLQMEEVCKRLDKIEINMVTKADIVDLVAEVKSMREELSLSLHQQLRNTKQIEKNKDKINYLASNLDLAF